MASGEKAPRWNHHHPLNQTDHQHRNCLNSFRCLFLIYLWCFDINTHAEQWATSIVSSTLSTFNDVHFAVFGGSLVVSTSTMLKKNLDLLFLPRGNIRNTEKLSYDRQQQHDVQVTAWDCGQKRALRGVPVRIDVKPACKPGWQGESPPPPPRCVCVRVICDVRKFSLSSVQTSKKRRCNYRHVGVCA